MTSRTHAPVSSSTCHPGGGICELPLILSERLQHHAHGAVFSEFGDFLFLEDAKGFGGIVGTVDGGGAEDVGELLLIETAELRIPRIQLRTQNRPALRIEGERLAFIPEAMVLPDRPRLLHLHLCAHFPPFPANPCGLS